MNTVTMIPNEYLISCSQCYNLIDILDLVDQDFDGMTLKICQNCLEEIMLGERTIVI
jgi:hypothetical protein